MPFESRRQAGGSGAVTVPRGVLVGLLAALVAALMALAFLLGRQAGPPSPVSPGAQDAERTPPGTDDDHAQAVRIDTQGSQPDAPAEVPSGETAEAASPAPMDVRVVPAVPGVNVFDAGTRTDVARYFAELDAIEASAKTWSDPQRLANEIVEQATSGNSSGFDALLATQRQARERLGAMAVPAACREHHAQVGALMDEAVALLADVRNAVTTGDMAALQAIAGNAQALEAKAKRLEAQATSLKQRYAG